MPPYCSMNHLIQSWGQQQQQQQQGEAMSKSRCSVLEWVEGAIIVGGGPSGMATAACLQDKGICNSVLLEKSNCIASLWQERTYDRLRLHLPKHFCQLPMSNFPSHFPTYPTKQQFVDYLEDYARKFKIQPRFGECVQSACFDPKLKLWRVETLSSASPPLSSSSVSATSESEEEDEDEDEEEEGWVIKEYIGRWLVVASGENAEAHLPTDLLSENLVSKIYHSSDYKNGSKFRGEKVLVVGAGNSGMEIALDLVQFGAKPTISVRSPIHILPREMLGKSTVAVSMMLLNLIPLWLTDRLLVLYASLALGDTSRYGIRRPKTGPLELKEKMGRTPVLDIGTLSHIKSGDIQVVSGIESFTPTGVKFVNGGEQQSYDSIIFATGYKSNAPNWLKDPELSFSCDGFPKCGWKAGRGLYTAGLSRKGILGVSKDAKCIAEDIHTAYIDQQQQQHKHSLTHICTLK